MNKNELKKREKLKLQKLAEKDEHVRYKIERIESLEKNARRNHIK